MSISPPREVMTYDIVIVGAGPAGLAAAIHLKDLARRADKNISICIVEKGAEVGAHLLSGAVLNPQALHELIPDWQSKGAPLNCPVIKDEFFYLTQTNKYKLPTTPPMKNHGNYIIKLGEFAKWLAREAETRGVEIYPGIAAVEIIEGDQGRIKGIITGDMGRSTEDKPGANFTPGIEIHANYTLIGEGCRGYLAEKLMDRFQLRHNKAPQTYALGIKELWEVDPTHHKEGLVVHTVGWPLDAKTYGGSFIYHLPDNQIAVGLVVGLDYTNPTLSPFAEMQKFKTHPAIRPLFEKGTRLAYGAKALNEGGWQSIPTLAFPGGLLLGCAAGLLNVPQIKGIHTAMKSGIEAAKTIWKTWDTKPALITSYEENLKNSWAGRSLYKARNIRPSFKKGLWGALAYSALDQYILRGKAPWTFTHAQSDYQTLKPKKEGKELVYPKPDGKVTFDLLSSVFLSNTSHREDAPKHLKVLNTKKHLETNVALYGAPETYYCPAGVYEIREDDKGAPFLQINHANCIHCKTCDIKDPEQNIKWEPPEGGSGPLYQGM